MRTPGTLLVLLCLAWPASLAATPDVAYEGRTYAVLAPAAGPSIGEAAAGSAAPFSEEATFGTVGGGAARAQAGRAEFEGVAGSASARFTSAVVQLQLPGFSLEARGVQAEALAACEGGYGRSRVDHLLVGGVPVTPLPGQRLALPGGFTLLLDERTGTRSAALAEQSTNALRVLDARGQTVAVVGHAEARAHGCARLDAGDCGASTIAVATARVGDRLAAGEPEALVTTPGGASGAAHHAWQNGVWTTLRMEYDAVGRDVTLTLRGASVATVDVAGFAPDAIVLVAHAEGGRLDVADVRVQDLALPHTLRVEGGQAAWTLRSHLLPDGYSLDMNVRLSWDPQAAPAPDALRLALHAGRCG